MAAMPTDKAPAFQFYPGDWLRDPELGKTSHGVRGIWIDLLCQMWFSNERGVLRGTAEELGRLARVSGKTILEQFIPEAERLRFCDVRNEALSENNGEIMLANRRMVRAEKDRRDNAKRQETFRRRHTEQRENNGAVTEMLSPSSSPTPNLHLQTPKKSKHIWPDGFILSESMKMYAMTRGIDASAEFAAWRDDCAAHARAYVDWEAAWRTRINNAPKFATRGNGATAPRPKQFNASPFMQNIDTSKPPSAESKARVKEIVSGVLNKWANIPTGR
jgi:hypothetical protein